MTKQQAANATILVVEDEESLNRAYQMILEQQGYDVKVAFDGDEALELTKTIAPDVILLDLRMPRMNGIEFLKNYNKSKPDKVKIIIFSNLDMQKEIDEAYKLGADRYILKAWASPVELIKIVKNALSE
jgi:two-component system response regulator VicR